MTAEVEPIVIVGIAFSFPDADNIEQLHANLLSGRSSIRNVSRWRRWFSNEPMERDYPMASLDRIDLFDRAFFGISEMDALSIDPQQRMALELAWSAIEDSATLPSRLQADRTGVFMSAARSDYSRKLGPDTALSSVGLMSAGVAGRLSYHLGLSGPSLVTDTACSGSLVALGMAMDALRLRRCDYAITGAVSLQVEIPESESMARFHEIMAPDGLCRAFDADAAGTADGEGGAVLLLKRSDDALRDHDHIYAQILSLGVNHNGDRSNGMAAPSREAQQELLLETWRAAGVAPADIGFIEAHGSGTRLGDAIELMAIAAAMESGGPMGKRCPIGSIKTNIGHLDHAAGLAGLIKAISSLQRDVIYPSVNFRRLNPDATAAASSIRVATAPITLREKAKFAGVSSFGITGTNTHAVLAAAPAAISPVRVEHGRLLVTISARTECALKEYCRQVADYVTVHGNLDLADVAYVLNACRTAFPIRVGWLVRDLQELAAAARQTAEQGTGVRPATASSTLVAVLPDEVDLGDALIGGQLRVMLERQGSTPPADAPAQELAYRLLTGAGLTFGSCIATGRGATVQQAVRETTRTEEADPQPSADGIDMTALRHAIGRLQEFSPAYVVLGAEGCRLGRAIENARALENAAVAPILYFPGDCEMADFVPGIILNLFLSGASINWEEYYGQAPPHKISLPTYPFARIRCWPLAPGMEASRQRPYNGAVAETRVSRDSEALREAFSNVLGVDSLEPDSDYFALGGNSIRGLELIAQIQLQTGVVISLLDLYMHPTLQQLGDYIAELRDGGTGEAPVGAQQIERTAQETYPLSYGQESLWFMNRVDPDSTVYNVTTDMRLRGDLDIPALERAIGRLVQRHETLRTHYVPQDGTVVAVVEKVQAPPPLPVIAVPPGSHEERDAAVAQMIKDTALAPYDLQRGPLFRTVLFELDDRDHILVCGTHHSVDDGWSPAIFDRELSAFYQAEINGTEPEIPPLPIQYGDFAVWQRQTITGDLLRSKLDFWLSYVAGSGPLELDTDIPRPAKLSDRGEHVYFEIEADLISRMREFAAGERCTLFTVAFGIFSALLYLESRSSDFLLGTIVAGRDRPETRDLIGYFNNMVAVRVDAGGRPSFRALIHRLRTTFISALDYQDVPFTKVVEALRPPRDLSRHPVFQIGFTYQNIPNLTHRMGGLASGRPRDHQYLLGLAPERAPWDLNLTLWEVDGDPAATAVFEFATDLFRRPTIETMATRLLRLVDQVLGRPDTPIEDLESLDMSGLRAYSTQCVAPFETVPPAAAEELDVLRLVRETAQRTPDRIAIIDETAAWLTGEEGHGGTSYVELANRAARVSAALRAEGIGTADIVALSLPRGGDLVVAMLAVWAAGAAFLPLDPRSPADRTVSMLESADASMLVCANDAARSLGSPRTIVRTLPDLEAGRQDGPLPDCVSGAPAYVIFTSGSTGASKPVILTHASLRPFIRTWQHIADQQTCPLRVLSLANSEFDVFTGDVLRSLGTAGCLVLPPIESMGKPRMIMDTIRRNNVNTMEFVPAHLRADLVEELKSTGEALLDLRVMIIGLEAWRESELVSTFGVLGKDAVIINVYGLTEAGIDSCCHLCRAADYARYPDGDQLVPIGKPYPEVRAYVLNDSLRPVAGNMPGELYVGGSGLALGYLGLPRLTAASFLPDPFSPCSGSRMYRTGDRVRRHQDGSLEFLGRLDDQMKLHGYRIEPTEIEGALRRHPLVRWATVRVHGDGRDAVLTAYLVPENSSRHAAAAELQQHLRGTLPAYMIPARYRWLSALPLSANGKVASEALESASEGASEQGHLISPRNTLEMDLVALYEDLLKTKPIGARDDFFALGGHSLLAVQLVAEIGDRFNVRLPLNSLFENPTPELLARALQTEGFDDAGPDILTLARGEGIPLVLVPPSGGGSMCYYALARALNPARTVLGLQSAGLNPEGPPLDSIEAMAAEFASRLTAHGLAGPLMVGGWSMGGPVAYELAHRLRFRGVDVVLTVLIDAEPMQSEPEELPEQDHELLSYLLVLNHDFTMPADQIAGLGPQDALLRVLQRAQDEGYFSPYMTADSLRLLLRVLRSNENALACYKPGRYGGDAILLRTQDGPAAGSNDADDLGWGAYVDTLRARHVQGTHFSVVPEEYQSLAQALSAELFKRNL